MNNKLLFTEENLFDRLPEEIIATIFQTYLDPLSWIRVGSVCRLFQAITQCPAYWKEHAKPFVTQEEAAYLKESDYMRIVKGRYQAKATLDKNYNSIFTTVYTWFTPNKSKLENIYQCLIQDDYAGLISLTLPSFKEAIACFIEQKPFPEITEKIKSLFNYNQIPDNIFNFLPRIIPAMIQARALNCYKVFICLYFVMMERKSNRWRDATGLPLLSSIIKNVFDEDDHHFIKELITLEILCCKPRFFTHHLILACNKDKKMAGLTSAFNDIQQKSLSIRVAKLLPQHDDLAPILFQLDLKNRMPTVVIQIANMLVSSREARPHKIIKKNGYIVKISHEEFESTCVAVINDDFEILFNVYKLEHLIALFKNEEISLNQIRSSLTSLLKNKMITLESIAFIQHLIPILIKVNARQCFEKCVALLMCISALDSSYDAILSLIKNAIFSTPYYIAQFILLEQQYYYGIKVPGNILRDVYEQFLTKKIFSSTRDTILDRLPLATQNVTQGLQKTTLSEINDNNSVDEKREEDEQITHCKI